MRPRMKYKELSFFPGNPHDFWQEYAETVVSVITMQAEIGYLAKKNLKMGAAVSEADVRTADGAWFIFGLRLLGKRGIKKCTGIGMIEALIADYPEKRTFLLGATAVNVKKAAESYQDQGLKVVGTEDGYQKDDEKTFQKIKESKAEVVLVGMSGVRQAELVIRLKKELGVTAITVGGSFDVASGSYKRAPKIIQRLALETPWRILQDPTRVKRVPRLLGYFWEVAKVIL
jgi:N-acetylglucosaminyldiphosphoundecaprenol N-acetyl-beta-D-mannosaminyltransferase